MKRTLFISCVWLWTTMTAFAQSPGNGDTAEHVVTFRFVPGQDMFFIPYGGNDAELNRLYALIDRYRTEITNRSIPIRVDGYCNGEFRIAVTRSNRVKSELITHKGLAEEHFITQNHATAYQGHNDIVIVTLPGKVPVPGFHADDRTEPEPEPQPEPTPEPQPQPQPTPEPEPPAPPVVEMPARPYCLAVRTNLLYDAFLAPTLGVEWRLGAGLGIKLDGSIARWGDKRGKVQKLWLINPEVRRYIGQARRMYLGVGGSFGEYNIYKGMLDSLAGGDTGYQGKLYGGGLTVGYQLELSRAFSLDFNLGLGYTRLEYDSFTLSNQTRVYKERDRTRNFWGPTQAGVSMVWTIGR